MNRIKPKSATLRALVVSGDDTVRQLLRVQLELSQICVREAVNSSTALTEFSERPSDLVLLDSDTNEYDAFALCRQLRNSHAGQNAAIVFLTPNECLESIERAFTAGATDFISKPLQFDLLTQRLRFLLRGKRRFDRLCEREESIAHAQRAAGVGDWSLSSDCEHIKLSEILREILGVDTPTLSQSDFLRSISDVDRARVASKFWRFVDKGSPIRVEFQWNRPDQRDIAVCLEAHSTENDAAETTRRLGTIQDITEHRNSQEQIRRLSFYDTVTNLPNRASFHTQLTRSIELANRQNQKLAVLFVSLDQFKNVNERLGHSLADEVLRISGARLQTAIRSSDLVAFSDRPAKVAPPTAQNVARVGGDEFIVLLSSLRRPEDAALVAQRLLDSISRPLHLQDTDVYLSCSIGISLLPNDSQDSDSLIKQASSAAREAKREGRNSYRFFTKEIQERASKRLNLEARLRRALEREEFTLYYQPKLDLSTNKATGMEALLRWNDPEFGTVSPADFIPLAEETGLIVQLGQWVIETACKQLKKGLDKVTGPIGVSVNLSALQLRQHNLVQIIEDALSSNLLPAELFELELTESVLIDNAEFQLKRLEQLRSLGIKMSIDDFGTGYSSLNYLRKFPIDTLKIDRSFVRDIATEPDDRAIVTAAIRLANSLRLQVVAEGVEDLEQENVLRQLGCDMVQGFLYCRPCPIQDALEWIEQHNCRDQNASSAKQLVD